MPHCSRSCRKPAGVLWRIEADRARLASSHNRPEAKAPIKPPLSGLRIVGNRRDTTPLDPRGALSLQSLQPRLGHCSAGGLDGARPQAGAYALCGQSKATVAESLAQAFGIHILQRHDGPGEMRAASTGNAITSAERNTWHCPRSPRSLRSRASCRLVWTCTPRFR